METASEASPHKTSDRSTTFIIPAFNEELGLEPTVRVVNAAASRLGLDHEVVVVDDGSKDGTWDVARRLSGGQPNLRVIRHGANRGLGAAYKSGVAAARKSHVILVPGDDAWPEEGVTRVLEKLGQADIVIPYLEAAGDKTAFRRLVSRAYTAGMNLLFGLDMPYYNGIVLHRTALIRSIDIAADDFTYQTEALVKLLRRGHGFVTVAARTNARAGGQSKAFGARNVLLVLSSVLRLFVRTRLSGKNGAG